MSLAFERPSTSPARTQRRLQVLLFLGALMPPLMLFALGAYALNQSHQQFEQRAELMTQNLAEALQHSLSANVEKIDMALNAIVDHLETQLAHGQLDLPVAAAHLRSQIGNQTELEGVAVTDRQGRVILNRGSDPRERQAVSLADRDWFKVQRDQADAGLHMSRPLLSKVTGQWMISLSRRYRTADGRFAGVACAAIPLSHLQRQLQAINAGPNGVVTLRDADLRLIARWPEAQGADIDDVGSQRVSPQLRALVNSGNTRATYHTAAPMDKVERTFSYRQLSVVPLLVIVGAGTEYYLADWYDERRAVLALCLGMVLLYGATGAVLRGLKRQHGRDRQRIELLAKVFEHSGEAIMVTDRSHRIVEVNPAFVRQTGYTPAEIVGQLPDMLQAPHTGAADTADMQRAVDAHGHWRGELWDRAKDGRIYPKWVSVSVVRDAQGEVTHHIANSIDVTEAKQAEDRIRHLAHHDTLTQLPNRVLLHGRLEQAMAAARRDGSELAMLFIDMDRFKDINDTLGHPVGDGLLVEVGQRLRALVRASDIVARLGGDEFVLVLTGTRQDAARAGAAVAAKVLAALGRPYTVRGHELHSTPSVGIALFPADGEDADTLMKNADSAMYHAKSAGRNNAQFFTTAMNRATQDRLALEAGLRGAIARSELFLHYQPQLDLSSQRIVGLEALLRWQHPEMGLIPPLKFIPVAEETGQIEAIGAWVLEEALRQVALWRGAGHAGLRIAVNLSAYQLRGDAFPDRVAQALRRHGLPGSALELEITESVAMRDPARTADMLRQLRRFGVALAIDDFGTGYSSLAYLKQLPLSCLKLDRSFVMDIERDANDAAICTATIQMAHSLGLGVVAEGVETATQLEFLRRLGCDTVQGYFIAKPLSAHDCAAFLHAQTAALLATVD
jgi:diguanylate cyclase (GGDEF)-like protein/PAS domain S-box-containing protein